MRHPEAVEGRSGVTHHLLGDDLLAVLVRDHNGITVCVKFVLKVLVSLGEHPVHTVGYAWRDVDVLEEREVGKADLEVVSHSVCEFPKRLYGQGISKSLLTVRLVVVFVNYGDVVSCFVHHEVLEFPHLEVDAVLEGRGVTERYLLIYLLLSNPCLTLERVETRHVEGDVGEGEGVTGVPGVLVVQGVHAEVELAVPVMGIGD